MPYNWRKAIANAGLVFIGCILAKVPLGEDMTLDWSNAKHVLVKCLIITFFAELRYIYSFLSTWGDMPLPPSTGGGTLATATISSGSGITKPIGS